MRTGSALVMLVVLGGCAQRPAIGGTPAAPAPAAAHAADSALTPRQRAYLDTLAARVFDSPVAPVALGPVNSSKLVMWLDYGEAQSGLGPIWLRVETPQAGFLTVVIATQRGGTRVFAPWLPSWSSSVRATQPAEAGRWSLALPGRLPPNAWLHASLTERPMDIRAFSHARSQGGRIAIGDFESGADGWDALLARSGRPSVTTSQRIVTGTMVGRFTGAETWRYEPTASTPATAASTGR